MATTSVQIGLLILLALCGGAALGMLIGRRLPERHLTNETRSVVSASMAVVGTMSALVLGLLISSGSSSFKVRNGNVALMASQIVQLDIALRRYGSASAPVRDALERYTAIERDDLFPDRPGRIATVDDTRAQQVMAELQDTILAFKPADDRQRWLSAQALQLTTNVDDTRAQLSRENVSSVPLPFLGAVLLWLIVLFASFGVFAPRNLTVFVAVFLCAFSIASAVKLILDMDTPFDGVIRVTRPPIHISSDPMRNAVEAIGR